MRVFLTGAVSLFSASLVLGLLGAPAEAQIRTIRLSGYDEVPVVITNATGDLQVRLPNAKDPQVIEYTLSYKDIQGGDVQQAHIHLGQTHVATANNIVVFLCTNLGNAPVSMTFPTPACPVGPGGSVEGKLDASNVIDRTSQGVGPGDLAAVIDAIKKGVAYGNVHTEVSPSGEIRANFPGKH